MLEDFNEFLKYLFRWRKGGALMHVYVLEHILVVSLCYRTAWWMFTKFGRDDPALVVRLFGKPRPGVDPGLGKNRSMRGPFSKWLLLQIGRLQWQNEWVAMILKHVGRRVDITFELSDITWELIDIFYAPGMEFEGV